MERAKPETVAKWASAKRRVAKSAARSIDRDEASKRIDKRIAELDDWRGETLALLRKIIHEVNPEVVEDWKYMGTPFWSHEGIFASADAFKDKVKLTFAHGAQLADPNKLFNAGLGGKKWRAIDIHEDDKIDIAALKALLREAMDYNAMHSVSKSKGSRDI